MVPKAMGRGPMVDTQPRRPAWLALARGLLETLAAMGLAVLVLLGLVTARYGSISAALGVWRGQGLQVDARIKSLGEVSAGQTFSVPFILTNLTSEPVRIVGSRTTCTCTVAEDLLPLDIAPGQRRPIRVSASPRSQRPQFRQSVQLYTDLPSQPQVTLVIVGTMKAVPSAPTAQEPARGEGSES